MTMFVRHDAVPSEMETRCARSSSVKGAGLNHD
jgi:hypothetical protein